MMVRKIRTADVGLADAIAKDAMDVPGVGEEAVSAAIEAGDQKDWVEKISSPIFKNDRFYKKLFYEKPEYRGA